MVASDYTGSYAPFGFASKEFEEGINWERLRRGRLQRARDSLFKKRQFGAFLSLNEQNMKYISGTYTPFWTAPSSGLRYMLLTEKGDWPMIYEQGDIGYHVRRMSPWIPPENISYAITGAGWIGAAMGERANEQQRKKMVQQIKDELARQNLLKETLAVDFLDNPLIQALEKEGINVASDGNAAMLAARRLKLPEEAECLKNAALIGDAIFGTIADTVRPGISEHEVLAEMFRTTYRLGGEVHNGMFVTSGPYTWPNLRATTGRSIRPGDVIYADTYNMAWNSYRTCYYRAFTLGRAAQSIKDAYKRAYDWLYDGIKAVKPGVTTKDIVEKWPPGDKIWGWYGVKNEDMTAGNNWMHGIGLALYEPPVGWRAISIDNPERIEPGMTFAIETQEGDRKTKQGVRIEEMIVVGESGTEIISNWPIEEITEISLAKR